MAKTKVCVIFGGMSNEHEVSLMSTKSVIDNIPADKYDVVKVGDKFGTVFELLNGHYKERQMAVFPWLYRRYYQ